MSFRRSIYEGLDPSVPATLSGDPHKDVSLEDQTLLLLAQLMEGGKEDEDTCQELNNLTKLLHDDSTEETRSSEPHRPLWELVDTESVETILAEKNMGKAKEAAAPQKSKPSALDRVAALRDKNKGKDGAERER